ncbi:MAG TPA: bifunctional diaminohydroxyphosphoribosylaminopyrimidine deaminase/5-amino-6-(5-phosphoribosylamino)uracil reductase RibD [Vicinamibacterales bacterium]|nr:bifunctional diaminohydroxyphosphoribosylaminopyrimidine deaminase/5-amino-6-(5-phosphoribosylamino)uracil reductase RibD [Vicinamibacterales bacterium]
MVALAETDARWMNRALECARRGLGRTTPNPLVGACIVSNDGVLVGQGSHERAGEPHAEVHALNEAGEAARGATLYCTLEPCAHTGRTGPCTSRIIDAGIRRVVTAMEDPFPQVNGRGLALLREHGIVVTVGVGREAAARLNQPFLTSIRDGRPFVILKAAASIDGRISAAPGCRTAITSAAAIRRAQYDRAWVDAVGVGSETVLVDDPLLTVREFFRERPLMRVIFDRRLRTPPAARVFDTLADGPVVVLTTEEALRHDGTRAAALTEAGATVIAPALPGVEAALRELGSRDVQSILIEGGAALHAALWDAKLADYVQLYVAPVVLGEGGVLLESRAFSTCTLFDRRVEALGPDVLIEGYVHRPH